MCTHANNHGKLFANHSRAIKDHGRFCGGNKNWWSPVNIIFKIFIKIKFKITKLRVA